MIHKAGSNNAGYLGCVRELRATNGNAFSRGFREIDQLTVFAFKDRLAIIGVPPSLRTQGPGTEFAFVDPMTMMARAHRNFAPKGPEPLRIYAEGRRRELPVMEILASTISHHGIEAVRPSRGFRRDGTGLTIVFSTRALTLTGKASYVQALGDWLDEIRQP